MMAARSSSGDAAIQVKMRSVGAGACTHRRLPSATSNAPNGTLLPAHG